MVAWRRMLSWLRGTAALVSGTALWLSFGALAFSDISSNADRVGVVPQPGWWVVCVVAAMLATHVASARTAWLLLIGVLAWLPWLPIPIPSVFAVWVGPVLVACATVVGVVWLFLRAGSWPALLRLWFSNQRRATLVAFVAAALVYAAGAVALREFTPGGDEPHYLVIAQSLLRDGDLRIENNHREGHYFEYHSAELRPDFLRRSVDGEIYSVHAPGLPAIVAPAYALGGYTGVTVFLIVLAAAGTSLAWRICFRVTGRADAAWFGWAAVAWSAPWVFHAFTVFPDGPAAVIVLTGVWALLETDHATPRARALQGMPLALLPWMHTRYAVLAGVLGAAILLRDRARGGAGRRIGAFLAFPLVSAVAWFGFFQTVYGTVDPSAPYGGWSQTGSSFETLARGFPALLFDQQFGLIANAPVFAFSAIGLWCLARTSSTRRLGWECIAIVLPYALQSTSYPMWWGGYSAPARFLAPTMLVLAVPAAALWAHARSRATQVFALAALGASWFITAAMVLVGPGRLVYNNRDGIALWLEWVSPLANLNAALPSFHRHSYGVAMTHTAVWCAVLIAAWMVARMLSDQMLAPVALQPTRETAQHGGTVHESGLAHESATRAQILHDEGGRADLAILLTIALAVSVAANAVWQQVGASGLVVTSSQAWALRTSSASTGLIALRYPHSRSWPRVTNLDAGLNALRFTSNIRRLLDASAVLSVRELPAGRYRVHVPLETGAVGELRVSIGQTSSAVARWPLASAPNSREFQAEIELPVPVHSVTVAADSTARDHVSAGWLELLHLGGGLPLGERAVRATRYRDWIAYFPNDDAFMEPTGFWLRPNVLTSVVAQRAEGAEPARLFLRNGPVANTVTLALGEWTTTATLQPGEEREIETGVRRGAPLLFRARATAGFRPRDVDPGSVDMRRLSLWVEFR